MAYNDKNDDDTFWWELDYAYIPRSRFTAIDTRSGTATGGTRVSIPAGSAVLRGFDLNFSSKDHHIQEVGLRMPDDGNLDIFYSDKNQDDKFDWRVQYGILGSAQPAVGPPSVSIQPTPLTAVRQSGGILSKTASAVILNGEAPYFYSWTVDNGQFRIANSGGQNPSVSANVAACDSAEGNLFVTITDALGQIASASAAVAYRATRPPGGFCD